MPSRMSYLTAVAESIAESDDISSV
jgi:hypothetical protein